MDRFIAYPSQLFDDVSVKETAEKWQKNGLIESESLKAIESKHPLSFYSPGLFTRIGIFIFTWLGYCAMGGLFTLMFFSSAMAQIDNQNAISFHLAIHTIVVFACLEFVIRERKAYKAGIDDALLYGGLGLLISFIFSTVFDYNSLFSNSTLLLQAIIAFVIFTIAAIRYVDKLVAACAYLSLLAIVFLSLSLTGEIGKMLMSFALMLVSAGIYFYVKKLKQTHQARFWFSSLWLIELLSLLVFYIAGNYFVVRSLSEEMFDMHLAEGEDIPLAFIFYIFTALVPVIYVWKGLQKKDRTLLISGLILVALSVLTFKYYFSLGHPEISLTAAGVVMILIAYAATRYFRTHKFGVTYAEDKAMEKSLLNLESVIIGQTINAGTHLGHDGFQFGGGKSGGGGADSEF